MVDVAPLLRALPHIGRLGAEWPTAVRGAPGRGGYRLAVNSVRVSVLDDHGHCPQRPGGSMFEVLRPLGLRRSGGGGREVVPAGSPESG